MAELGNWVVIVIAVGPCEKGICVIEILHQETDNRDARFKSTHFALLSAL
jgi:hypothetical protein